jgi:hypothetical protein
MLIQHGLSALLASGSSPLFSYHVSAKHCALAPAKADHVTISAHSVREKIVGVIASAGIHFIDEDTGLTMAYSRRISDWQYQRDLSRSQGLCWPTQQRGRDLTNP